jgi:tryptophan halogenase
LKVKSVIVVGGGSSGWCSAAALAKFCPNLDITVIESSDIPTVGVGESTIQYFNTFARLLDLKDTEWMPYCNATYKGAIRFTDFNKGQHYYAPFKDINSINYSAEDWAIISALDKTITPNYFAKYVWPGSYLLDENKVVGKDATVDFSIEQNTSYNLDASKFGEYLREQYCKPRGVKHIVDTIRDIGVKDGNIESLNAGKYSADLFIDCTGFSSLLLEKTMGAEFEYYDDLFNDRAVVFNNIQYTDKHREMETYTNTIAKDYGWVWNIPLWNRISNGYVYSSKFTTDEEALGYLKDHVTEVRGQARADDQTPKYITIKNGRHDRAWIGNVVGVGLSYGFIEPLGSTGLLLTQKCIVKLATVLNARNYDYNSFDRENFNVFSQDLIDNLKDFYLIHFVTTQREDTPYWHYIKYNVVPNNDSFKSVQRKLAYIANDTPPFNTIDVWHWQLYGMGYNSYTADMFKHIVEGTDIVSYGNNKLNQFKKQDQQLTDYVKQLPTVFEYLSKNIYGSE